MGANGMPHQGRRYGESGRSRRRGGNDVDVAKERSHSYGSLVVDELFCDVFGTGVSVQSSLRNSEPASPWLSRCGFVGDLRTIAMLLPILSRSATDWAVKCNTTHEILILAPVPEMISVNKSK